MGTKSAPPQVEFYCRCGESVRVKAGKPLLFTKAEILTMFEKHFKKGCKLVEKKDWQNAKWVETHGGC